MRPSDASHRIDRTVTATRTLSRQAGRRSVVEATMTSVAFVGLGVMGRGMAGRLLDAGFPLAVWNRRRDRTDALAERGARLATSPHDAAGGADVIVSMVADDDASK